MSKNITSCGLLQFAAGRRMSLGTFVNKETGEEFKSCVFTDKEGNHEFCHFGKKLGVLTAGEISRRKNELIVVRNLETNRCYLAVSGSNWEEIEL